VILIIDFLVVYFEIQKGCVSFRKIKVVVFTKEDWDHAEVMRQHESIFKKKREAQYKQLSLSILDC
jgi:hypothetical protein